jgi:hypothetical protein
MKQIYFVTEGNTGQIVLEGLIARWLGATDFIPRHIQPPSSAYAEGLDSRLSQGWKGVLAWCEGRRRDGAAGRDEALKRADCLIIHTDADVATDTDFKNPAYAGPPQPASGPCNCVRSHLASLLGGNLPANAVLCVPSRDMDAWVLCCLHPEVADNHMPIECHPAPDTLLVRRPPYRLIREKDGSLKKETARYRQHQQRIAVGWPNCATGTPPRCPEAARFESEAGRVLGV